MTAAPRLAGRVAVVTGASRGIGAAIARRFAAEGVQVVNASEMDPVMGVNVRGVLLCSKYAIEALRETRGVIINMASINAYWAEPQLAVYSASKAAVLQLSRCMALDHAGDGIRCSAICPGYEASFASGQPFILDGALSSGRVFDWGGAPGS